MSTNDTPRWSFVVRRAKTGHAVLTPSGGMCWTGEGHDRAAARANAIAKAARKTKSAIGSLTCTGAGTAENWQAFAVEGDDS